MELRNNLMLRRPRSGRLEGRTGVIQVETATLPMRRLWLTGSNSAITGRGDDSTSQQPVYGCAFQSVIDSVVGYWFPVGRTPLSHFGRMKLSERKNSGSEGSSLA